MVGPAMNERELSRVNSARGVLKKKKRAKLTRKCFKEEHINLTLQSLSICAPYFVCLRTYLVGQRRRCVKPHLLFVHEHDKSGSSPDGKPRCQLVSSPHLNIYLDESNKTGSHPLSFLFGDLLENWFNEVARCARSRREERDNSTMRD